jgi:urease beta subunit
MSRTGIRKIRGARALLAAAALIALAAPSGAQASTAGLSPSSLDFPDTLVGMSSPDQQVYFTNDGPDPVDVSGVSIGGEDPSDFTVTVDYCTGVTLAASESCELRVGFAPVIRGALSAELDVSHTGDGGLATAALTGKGVIRELTVSPGQLDFSATTVNYPGGEKQVEVKNTGDLPVNVNNVFIDGSEGADFNQNNNCGGQLNPEQKCNVNVAFWPHGEGTRAATLHLSSDASNPDETVPLSGTGAAPQLAFEPNSYDFGLQQINSNSTQTTILLRNTGAAPVQVNSIDFLPPGPSAFWTGYVSCWGVTLQPNDTCSVQVNFGPNQPIAYSAQLRATVNGISFTADLSGQGGQPVFTATPSPADFGSATVGQPGLTRTITLTNEGDLPGGFFVAIVSGGDVGSFRLLHEDCTGAQLDPSASCTAQVRFQPDSAGAKLAQFTLVGGQGQPFQINLTGAGIDPQASLVPDSHDFGRQVKGTGSRAQSFAFANEGGTPLHLTEASIVGSEADQFRLTSDECTDAALPAGGSCQVQVKFAPDADGASSARLRLSGDGGPYTSALIGTGVAAGDIGVRFRWRRALHARGKGVVVGWATCHGAASCKLSAHAVVAVSQRGDRGGLPTVNLPAVRLKLGADETRSLRLRMPAPARRAAGKGGRLRLKLDWSADGSRGHSSSQRRLGR